MRVQRCQVLGHFLCSALSGLAAALEALRVEFCRLEEVGASMLGSLPHGLTAVPAPWPSTAACPSVAHHGFLLMPEQSKDLWF